MVEIVDIQEQLQEKWMVLWWSLGVSIIALAIAWRQGLFKPFRASPYPMIKGKDVLKGFTFFLFMEVVLIPVLVGVVFILTGRKWVDFAHLNPFVKGWMYFSITCGGFVGVMLVYLTLAHEQQRLVWQQTSTPWYRNLGIGVAIWLVGYPLVLVCSQGISIIVWQFFDGVVGEQSVVKHLREIAGDPWLFGFTALSIVTLVPVTEELLFRGLLQSWLKHRFHYSSVAIVLTSVVFSIFHYSGSQGIANIELLFSLFLLSCILGFIYERQRSLWAPIGLHSFFNLMSLLIIFKD